MDPAVEIEPNFHSLGLGCLDPFHDVIELLVGSDPVEFRRRVHLDSVEALLLALLGRLADLVRPVAADPGVGTDLVADPAAKHLPRRKPKSASLEVPQRLFEPGERGHDHCPAAVEAAAIADLPNVL